jgi:hypothetical protein
MRIVSLFVLGLLASAALAGTPKGDLPLVPPIGGENSPRTSPPPKLAIALAELSAGAFAVRAPSGSYLAPKGGAPNYTIPGPIAAFKGADGVWRGHGYLETLPRLLKFEGSLKANTVEMVYTFQEGKSYKAKLTAANGAILLEEESNLGPRNLYVFDCTYGDWEAAAAFAVNLAGTNHAFLYMPCYYDRTEVTINPAAAPAKPADPNRPAARPEDRPGAAAVLSADAAKRDVAGFWCRDVANWKNGDQMSIQLWQHRQLPGDPGSRHFLGPETKSDSTPNPRTAGMLGKSLYEGHVTIEMSLGAGTRKLGFAALAKPEKKADIPEAFKRTMAANR